MESLKRSELKMVMLLRSQGRENILEKARQSGVDFSFQIDAVSGRPQFINLLVKNPYPSETLFKVFINEPAGSSNELQLVNNTEGEWEYWQKTRSRQLQPDDYSVISKYNDFILKPF